MAGPAAAKMLGAGAYGALLEALRGATWPARHAVRQGPAGSHHSRLRGPAVEFTEYRRYRQGDDPGRLDWKLLARTDRPYLRIAHERAVLPTLVLVDASASMAFPLDSRDKWRQACQIAVGLAAAAHRGGDPVGVRVVGPGGGRLRPTSRRDLVVELTQLLEETAPGGDAPLGRRLAEEQWPGRVALISDFLGDEADTLTVARASALSGVDLYAIHIVAPEELNPSDAVVSAVDPEHPAVRGTLGPETRQAYLDAFAAWREHLADRWRAMGARYVLVRTDQAAVSAVRAILEALT